MRIKQTHSNGRVCIPKRRESSSFLKRPRLDLFCWMNECCSVSSTTRLLLLDILLLRLLLLLFVNITYRKHSTSLSHYSCVWLLLCSCAVTDNQPASRSQQSRGRQQIAFEFSSKQHTSYLRRPLEEKHLFLFLGSLLLINQIDFCVWVFVCSNLFSPNEKKELNCIIYLI